MSGKHKDSVLTAVMYHYVRDLAHTPYPAIKGRRVEEFQGQLDYLARHYTLCSPQQVIAACRGGDSLPPRPCLLTFDDGLADCFQVALPVLRERKLSAMFFVPARSADLDYVLDVHKIHFVLAVARDFEALLAEIKELAKPLLPASPGAQDPFTAPVPPTRFDPPVVVRIKRLLQRTLPEKVRAQVAGELFRRHVTRDEAGFARGLYMGLEQLRAMIAEGMVIGGHGHGHFWMEDEPASRQQDEIQRMVEFLEKLYGRLPQDWTMSYPFGSYTPLTIDLVRKAGCAMAFTSRVGLAGDLSRPLELDRLDTNDLPLTGDAPLSPWTLQARGTQP